VERERSDHQIANNVNVNSNRRPWLYSFYHFTFLLIRFLTFQCSFYFNKLFETNV